MLTHVCDGNLEKADLDFMMRNANECVLSRACVIFTCVCLMFIAMLEKICMEENNINTIGRMTISVQHSCAWQAMAPCRNECRKLALASSHVLNTVKYNAF